MNGEFFSLLATVVLLGRDWDARNEYAFFIRRIWLDRILWAKLAWNSLSLNQVERLLDQRMVAIRWSFDSLEIAFPISVSSLLARGAMTACSVQSAERFNMKAVAKLIVDNLI